MKNIIIYLGLSLLFTHELDAMTRREWRIIPGLNALSDASGETLFVLAHIPLYMLVLGFIASANERTRAVARAVLGIFLVAHAGLHYLFSGQASYPFSSGLSSVLIYGAAVCGLAFLALAWFESRRPGV
jgi:hypothetical protein